MNMITQEARKKQAIVKYAEKIEEIPNYQPFNRGLIDSSRVARSRKK